MVLQKFRPQSCCELIIIQESANYKIYDLALSSIPVSVTQSQEHKKHSLPCPKIVPSNTSDSIQDPELTPAKWAVSISSHFRPISVAEAAWNYRDRFDNRISYDIDRIWWPWSMTCRNFHHRPISVVDIHRFRRYRKTRTVVRRSKLGRPTTIRNTRSCYKKVFQASRSNTSGPRFPTLKNENSRISYVNIPWMVFCHQVFLAGR